MKCICHLSQIPLRKEDSDRSEMVSQLLFGEIAEVIEEKNSWFKLKVEYDGYIGWADKKQCTPISNEDLSVLMASPLHLSSEIFQSIGLTDGNQMPLVMGSSLFLSSKNDLKFSNMTFTFGGSSIKPSAGKGTDLLNYAMKYLNAPYLWGGRSPFGIDCSGFTQIIMKFCGIKLWRDAAQQSEQGTTINMIEEAEVGDLAFFDNAEGRIVHVGIILANQKIIHASGKVRVDTLDHEGIYNSEINKYTHKLRLIKRVF